MPPAKVAVSAPAYAAPLITKYTQTPTAITTLGHGSVYDASYSNIGQGAYYSSAPKVLAPAVATTYASTPTAAPIACECDSFIGLILLTHEYNMYTIIVFNSNSEMKLSYVCFSLDL